MNSTSPSFSFNWQHGSVLGVGLLIFVLLIFADKSNLNNDQDSDLSGKSSSEGATPPPQKESLLALLPPLQVSDTLSQLIEELDKQNGAAERAGIYKEVVDGLMKSGRYDAAAAFASQLAEEQDETKNLLVAGALLRNASETPPLLQDSILFRKFMDQSILYLEKAEAKDGKNVEVLLELGLAYVGSRNAGMGMQGILKIRSVLDIDPDNEEASFHLGRFSMDTGQFDKAQARFEKVLELNPDNLKAKYYLALAHRNLGNSSDFRKLITQVAQQQQDLQLAALATELLKETK